MSAEKIKNKLLFAMEILFIVLAPSVSAASSSASGALDLYYLFVEAVFGNYLFAVFGLGIMFFLFGIIMKMSESSLMTLMFAYLAIIILNYVPGLVVPLFILSIAFFIFSIFRALRKTET